MNIFVNMRNLISFLLLFFVISVQAQESFDYYRVMHYNLLNYRNTTDQCDATTNSPTSKDAYLKTILNYVKPDIVTLNEVGANPVNASRLLSNAFVVSGKDYDFANYTNNGSSSLVNLLFFDKNKFRLYRQESIDKSIEGQLLVRLIDIYTLYYHEPVGLSFGDTIFLHVAVAHLKAGDTSADKEERKRMTAALLHRMRQLKTKPQNWLLCGDFNIQSSTESSYQQLLNDSNALIRFYDPVNSPGTWNNNANFSNLHTQSTRSSSTNGGCFSSSGLDDRFDFILASEEIIKNTQWVGYLKNSYKAIGQDGGRFNSSINSPANIQVPSEVVDALYNMSDHLPVMLELSFRTWIIHTAQNQKSNLKLFQPVRQNLILEGELPEQIEISDISGRKIKTILIGQSSGHFESFVGDIRQGVYVARFIYHDGSELRSTLLIQP